MKFLDQQEIKVSIIVGPLFLKLPFINKCKRKNKIKLQTTQQPEEPTKKYAFFRRRLSASNGISGRSH
jgi:hypothetical protein